jgi:hypothetical protein
MYDGPSFYIVTTWKEVLKNGADLRESLGHVRGIVSRKRKLQFSFSPRHV